MRDPSRRLPSVLVTFGLAGLCLTLPRCTTDGGSSKDTSRSVKVRLATLFSKDHYLARKLDWVAAELEERSGGRFECRVFPGGLAGGEKENLEDLLLGNLEVMNGAGSYFYHYCPEANVIELPLYGWESREEARDVIRSYWPRFVEVAQAKGFYPLALDVRDYWGVLYKTPIVSLDALEGARFRSVNAEFWIEMTQLHGAVPNPMPYADAYLAFKMGVSDGVLTSVTNLTPANWHEVLRSCWSGTSSW